MKYLEDVLIAPVISEKSYDRISDSNSYSFFVHPKTDKPQIKKAVEEMFGVKVLRVNTMYRKGKKKRFGYVCLLYTSPSPRDKRQSRMPSSA